MKYSVPNGFTGTARLGLPMPIADNVFMDYSVWSAIQTQVEQGIGGSEAGASYYDDFWSLRSEWTSTVTGTGAVAIQNLRNGVVALSTGATSGSSAKLTWNNRFTWDAGGNLVFGLGVWTVGCATNCLIDIGLANSGNSQTFWFQYSAGAAASTWAANCANVSTVLSTQAQTTTQDTALWLRCEVNSLTGIAVFYAIPMTSYNTQGTPVTLATINNIASPGTLLQPYLSISNSAASNMQLFVDGFYVTSDR